MTNYIELNMDGRQIGLKFGLPAVRRITKATLEAPILTESGNYNELGLAYVLLGGYENQQMILEKVPVLKLSDFNDYVEKCWVRQEEDPQRWADLQAVLDFFAASFVVARAVERGKKKLMETTQMSSLPTPNTGTSSKASVTDNSAFPSETSNGHPSVSTSLPDEALSASEA